MKLIMVILYLFSPDGSTMSEVNKFYAYDSFGGMSDPLGACEKAIETIRGNFTTKPAMACISVYRN